MTLTEALAVLHRAGRIRSPWLPGMWTDTHVRITETQHDGYPGLIEVADDEGTAWVRPVGVEIRGYDDEECDIGSPVTDDSATVGCLLALLREARRDPGIVTDYHVAQRGDLTTEVWWTAYSCSDDTEWAGRPTEGEAIEAALISLSVSVGGAA